MSYHNLLSKTDRAVVAYIIAEGAGLSSDTYPAKRAGNKSLPDTVVHSESAEEAAPATNVYRIQTAVHVRSHADEGADISESRVAATFDLFHAVGLAPAITSAAQSAVGDLANFTCQGAYVASIEQSQDESGAWLDTLNLILTCNPVYQA